MKINYKKILITVLWVIALSSLMTSLSFIGKKERLVKAENIDINALEKALNSHPAIENADMSVDVNGDIRINVTQRTPMVRILTMGGESYYIDTQSKLMPLSDKYTARVLVVNGNVH